MLNSFETMIGLRYVRARRRNHFISFISMTSMLGLALGVMALIVVLSVMNGFEKELKERILGMASHATISGFGSSLSNWQPIAEEVLHHPEIIGVAPYVHAEGMLVKDKSVNGAIIRGILPTEEPKVAVVTEKMIHGDLNELQAGAFNIVLGKELARKLGIIVGDKVTLVAPQANVTPAGILPRLKRFTLVGIFEVGMNEFDSGLALIHMDDAFKLFRKTSPTGLRLKTTNISRAPIISREIASQLPGRYWVVDWTQQHANFFDALKLEKTVMFFILILIVAVAAFNIISTLVMMVSDKQADIAVLRTLGASPGSILKIFMLQGTIIGLVGISLGLISGVWVALNVPTLISGIEEKLGFKFLKCDVYYICDLPSDMHWNDVTTIGIVSFVLCLLATIYPALRASRTQPAEALRYE
jgi:lipoprotein-releasing system permease protein